MNAKEKARDLYDAFKHQNLSHHAVRLFALICVDEIINANPTGYKLSGISGPDANFDAYYRYENNAAYWQQVKEELQKM